MTSAQHVHALGAFAGYQAPYEVDESPDSVKPITNGKHPPQLSAKRLMRLALKLPPTEPNNANSQDSIECRSAFGAAPTHRAPAITEFVDPQKPLERFSCQNATRFSEEQSLPPQKGSKAPVYAPNARETRRSLETKNTSISIT